MDASDLCRNLGYLFIYLLPDIPLLLCYILVNIEMKKRMKPLLYRLFAGVPCLLRNLFCSSHTHSHTHRHTCQSTRLTHKLGEEDDEEGRDEVVDALHVATCWMSDGPDKQNPLKDLTQRKNKQKQLIYNNRFFIPLYF